MRRKFAVRRPWLLSVGALILVQALFAAPLSADPPTADAATTKALADANSAIDNANKAADAIKGAATLDDLIKALDKTNLTNLFQALANAQAGLKAVQTKTSDAPKAGGATAGATTGGTAGGAATTGSTAGDPAPATPAKPSDPLGDTPDKRDAASKALKDAIVGAPALYNKMTKGSVDKLKTAIDAAKTAITGFGTTAKSDDWKDLTKKLDAVRTPDAAALSKRTFKNDQKALADALALSWIGDDKSKAETPADSTANAKAQCDRIAPEIQTTLPDLADRVKAALADRTKSLEDDFGTIATHPSTRAKGIADRQLEEKNFVDAADALLDAIAALGAWDPAGGTPGKPNLDLAARLMPCRQSREMLASIEATLPDAVNGSAEAYVGRIVPLYYVRDVPSLIHILNPTLESSSTFADPSSLVAQRTNVLKAQDAVETAAIAQAGAKTKLANLRQQADAALAKLNNLNVLLRRQQNDLQNTKTRTTILDGQIADLQTQTQAKPNDARLAAHLRALQDERTRLGAQSDAQSAAITDTTSQRDDAKHAYDDSDASAQGLKQQVDAGQTALETAAVTALGARQSLRLAEAGEDAEFIKFRDAHPLIATQPSPTSTDPTKRVQVFGFEGASELFLRGSESDLETVERIVAEYDQPTPQARLTVWELQLNVAQNDEGPAKYAKIRRQVEADMRDLRTAMTGRVDLFVKSVNDVANDQLANTTIANYGGYYSSYVVNALAAPVRIGAGSQSSIRDPRSANTLGEALLVMMLSSEAVQKQTWLKYLNALETDAPVRSTPSVSINLRGVFQRALSVYGQRLAADIARTPSDEKRPEPFGRLRQRLHLPKPTFSNGQWRYDEGKKDTSKGQTNGGASDKSGCRNVLTDPVPYERISPMQTEIVYALSSRRQVVLAKALNELLPQVQSATIREGRVSGVDRLVVADQAAPFKQALASPEALRQFAANASTADLLKLQDILTDSYGRISSVDPVAGEFSALVLLLKQQSSLFAQTNGDLPLTSWERLSIVDRFTVPSAFQAELNTKNVNARTAAADAMLKEVMKAMEDDFDEFLVQPGIEALQKDVTAHDIQFGKLQKTSLLVSNRFLARVDARATAEVAPGKQTDILSDALALAQIVSAASGTNPVGLLGLLQGTDKGPPPANEIYGITSSGTLQVTPVFEPSGQALRFTFDYGVDTRIAEPNGTVNPRVPQIERHTVHNEMQVGNLELREASSFSATSKLGLPTKKWGGIPILNDIPVLNEIPIIGWFHYRRARAAVSQESIIFAQSALYPTVGDLLNLFGGN